MPTTTPHRTPDSRLGSGSGSDACAEQMGTIVDTRLDEGRFRCLLGRWNRHQDLRRDGADIATLARSREVLDAAREALRSAPYGRAA